MEAKRAQVIADLETVVVLIQSSPVGANEIRFKISNKKRKEKKMGGKRAKE